MFLFAICFLLLVCSISSAEYEIVWWTIDCGGGLSAEGNYSLNGTIGQSDASTEMIGGNYSLTGGFWYSEVKVKVSSNLWCLY